MSDNSSSLGSGLHVCPNSSFTDVFNNAYDITGMCLRLPLSISILYLGHRQWGQQRSFKTMSHSDLFTYHNAMLELISGLGTVAFLFGFYYDLLYVRYAGYGLSSLIFSGETSFHLLTCMERYLAVVHPIIYLKQRHAQGVRIRNISIGCAWLLCFVMSTIATLSFPAFPTIPVLCLLVFSIAVVSFCSLSVLCVLVRPGPGEGGRDREQVDQLKQRAFVTIMAITGVLWLWFTGFFLCFALGMSPRLCEIQSWMLRISGFWFSLPSSLVLPLLYLHRTGKLSCCCQNSG